LKIRKRFIDTAGASANGTNHRICPFSLTSAVIQRDNTNSSLIYNYYLESYVAQAFRKAAVSSINFLMSKAGIIIKPRIFNMLTWFIQHWNTFSS